MSIMTNPIALQARGFLRKAGFTKLALRYLRSREYEALFTASMKSAVKPRWCVWDVGANVGFYSRLFAEWVGPDGSVIAFEPSLATRTMMDVNLPSNLTLLPFALAAKPGKAMLDRGETDTGETAQISESGTEEIDIETGDNIVFQNPIFMPDMVKVDVEGYELEVLNGMQTLLSNSKLQKLFIEVHFAILGSTGRNHVPAEIEGLLRSYGFKIKWIDQSHLCAAR
jgi:FkbM family methyltransferase